MDCRKWLDKYSTDCTLKYPSEATRKNYISVVNLFLREFDGKYREPKEIPTQCIKEWILKANTINTRKHLICGVKSFYQLTLGMPNKIDSIPYPKKERKLPIVLSQSEIQDLITACSNLKHKAIICVMYSTGIRISELLNIKLKDIDRKNMVIHIMNGKGGKQRQVTLNESILKLIETYWFKYRTKEYLFEGQFGGQYSSRSVNEFLKKYANDANINKRVYAHLIRHCTGTHLTEAGVNQSLIQRAFGHNSPKTTSIYQHISPNLIANMYSPIQSINL